MINTAYTGTMYKVHARGTVRRHLEDLGNSACALMKISADQYNHDPLYINPEGFVVYDPGTSRTIEIAGNTNYLQQFAFWHDLCGKKYYVDVQDLERF